MTTPGLGGFRLAPLDALAQDSLASTDPDVMVVHGLEGEAVPTTTLEMPPGPRRDAPAPPSPRRVIFEEPPTEADVGAVVSEALRDSLTDTIAPILEEHLRVVPFFREEMKRRLLFGTSWRKHKEFFENADPLVLAHVERNARLLNKNLNVHSKAAEALNDKLEHLLANQEAKDAEKAEFFYLKRSLDTHGKLSKPLQDWAKTHVSMLKRPELSQALGSRRHRPLETLVQRPHYQPERDVLNATVRERPPIGDGDGMPSIRRSGDPLPDDDAGTLARSKAFA